LPCFHLSVGIDNNITRKKVPPHNLCHSKTKVLPRKIKQFDTRGGIFFHAWNEEAVYSGEEIPGGHSSGAPAAKISPLPAQ